MKTVMVQDAVPICPLCGAALRKINTATDIVYVCNDRCRHILKVVGEGQSQRELKCEIIGG